MKLQSHLLSNMPSGVSRALQSLHFGAPGSGKKAYLQASLHADEIPGMLVLQHLRAALLAHEEKGEISGEIVLVPMANPIGVDQEIHGTLLGRFDVATGINFNRGYQHLTPALLTALNGVLGDDASANERHIRQHAQQLLAQWQPGTEAGLLKKTLQSLAIDADLVLDLHCDNQAVMHVYTGTPLQSIIEPLAAWLGAEALLVATASGDDPFDESCSRHWWELKQQLGATHPIPLGCAAATIELRGETDVSHAHATADAAAIVAYLRHQGFLTGTPLPSPEMRCAATPLEGVEPIVATQAGVLVFSKNVGDTIVAGDAIAEVVDPISGATAVLRASVSGVLFARVSRRMVRSGASVAKVAGATAFRSGNLLSA